MMHTSGQLKFLKHLLCFEMVVLAKQFLLPLEAFEPPGRADGFHDVRVVEAQKRGRKAAVISSSSIIKDP